MKILEIILFRKKIENNKNPHYYCSVDDTNHHLQN